MRFVLAIVAFVLAAVMIVFGIAQRTVFLEPSTSSLSASTSGSSAYTVIDSSALSASPGNQTIRVSGSESTFLAYGRTADVTAWIGGDAHAVVSLDDKTQKLVVTEVEADVVAPENSSPAEGAALPEVNPVTNPAGSDLWLQEFEGASSLTKNLNLPEGISIIVASDGTAAAPSEVTMTWAADNSTPWAGPLLVGGAALLLIGLVMYILALLHLRRSRRPRRNVPRGPRLPYLPRVPLPKALKAGDITGSGRPNTRSMIAVVPMLLISGLVLSGCSADLWPAAPPAKTAGASETPMPSPTPESTDGASDATEVPPAAATVPQIERIVTKIATLAADADASMNAETIATRFTGTALEQRLKNYTMRGVDPAIAAPAAIGKPPLSVTLPQQSESWPRVVMTVIQQEDKTIPPTTLILRQETPRADYLVEYAISLEAGAQVPHVAPAAIGAPAIAPDNKLLLLPPNQVAAAYADVLLQGEASPSWPLFQTEGDEFLASFVKSRSDHIAQLAVTATLAFETAAGEGRTVALATNDSGAIVAVNVNETEIATVVNGEAVVNFNDAGSKALSGVTSSAKGIQKVLSDQLLFYVPAVGSTDKITLLGSTQGLISASELP
ncbi:hypothetical protein [Cryobacterium psychrophilum]|uniref:DUF8094 domain-containing protein n=1 Tax=Cryobacterium psychrophilum TaxID=41988 RepID=A0A4Y8KLL3_9MICO|nr:hypothetical protein [Cryobacterium psychrophilum]TDW31251.1 hypothetical protein EDD25_3054 [Cryobacterium psychrophilum]TFD78459.1 hypothetical protein E3T53_09710 [Cryobacterium psychrophilum]